MNKDILENTDRYFVEYVQIFYEMSAHILRTVLRFQWTPPRPWQGLEGEGL